MKKTTFIRVLPALSMLVIGLVSYGQPIVTNLRFSGPTSSVEDTISTAAAQAFGLDHINLKAIRNFNRSFKNVSNEKWYEADDASIVTFTSGDIEYRVDYYKKGYWLHTMRTYDETKMEGDLRHTIKSTYYDYEINLVHEIESPNAPLTYIVQLIGKAKVIILRIHDGEMEEWQKFDKSK